MPSKIPREDLLEEIHRLADGEEPPSSIEMEEDGRYSAVTYENRFGSWRAALEAAGFDGPRWEQTDEDLLAALRAMADDLGRSPTSAEMKADGPHTAKTYQRRFGSWKAALEAAGLDPVPQGYPEPALLAELRRLADELGRVPTPGDIRGRGEISYNTYYRRFDSFDAAVERAGIETDDE